LTPLSITNSKNSEVLRRFRDNLLDWYDESKRDLPWRKTSDPYSIWISEVMLQQTQVQKVLRYYTKFLAALPTLESLAEAELDTVLKLWEGLGYYARARNLHKAARHIVESYDGKIPQSCDELVQIRGIGPYTAAAVASIAFSEARAVVDGNVVRVLSRLYHIDSDVGTQKVKQQLAEIAQNLIDHEKPGDFNQAIMELGATLCTPKTPKCLFCPVSDFCKAFHELDTPARLPVKRPGKKVPHYNIASALIWDENYLFIDRRKESGMLGGLWEFPGQKIPEDGSAHETITKHVREEFELEVEVGDFCTEVKHAYTHFKITIHAYHCLYKSGEPKLTAATDWKWVKPDELHFYAFSTAHKKIIQKLISDFASEHDTT